MLDQDYAAPATPGPSSSNEAADSSTSTSAVTRAPRYLNEAFEQLRSSFFTHIIETQALIKTIDSSQAGTHISIQRHPSEEPISVVVPTHVALILGQLFLMRAQMTAYSQTPANVLFRRMIEIQRIIRSTLKEPSAGMTDGDKQEIQKLDQGITQIRYNTGQKLEEIARQGFTRYHYCALTDTVGQYVYADIRHLDYVTYSLQIDAASTESRPESYLHLLDFVVNNSVMMLAGITEPAFIEALVYVGVDLNRVQVLPVKEELNTTATDAQLRRRELIRSRQFIAAGAAPKGLPAEYEFTALSMAILFSNQEGVKHLLAAGADPNRPQGLFSPLFALAKRSGPLHRVVPLGERGGLRSAGKVDVFDALYQAGARQEEILTRAASERCKAEPQQLETSSSAQTDADERQAAALTWAREHEYEAMRTYVTREEKPGAPMKAFTLMGTSTNLYSGSNQQPSSSQTSVPPTFDCRLQ